MFLVDSADVGRIVCGGILLQRQAGPHDRLSDGMEVTVNFVRVISAGFSAGRGDFWPDRPDSVEKPFPQLENLAGLCLLACLCMESLFPLPVPV